MKTMPCKNCCKEPQKKQSETEVVIGCCSGAAWGRPESLWTVLNSWNAMQMSDIVKSCAESKILTPHL